MAQPIVQFGTSRFLQAHVDLFVSEALAKGVAIGGICVVQTTSNPISEARLSALATAQGFPVRIRGLENNAVVDRVILVDSVREALHARRQWDRLLDIFSEARVVVSNTSDAGFALSAQDGPELLDDCRSAPASFPAKLLVLLQHRWRTVGAAPITILPTELVGRNGDTLRDLVLSLAERWQAPFALQQYLREGCVWVNSLVDRIVSEALHPIGAVAEPYALWAVERQSGATLPCLHEALVVTDQLAGYERLKLFFLNLGHTVLAERWLRCEFPASIETVLDAMQHERTGSELMQIWLDEVMPVFDALDMGPRARKYVDTVQDRFCNPFLNHALSDIASHHVEKKTRRIGALLVLSDKLGLLPGRQHRLRALMSP